MFRDAVRSVTGPSGETEATVEGMTAVAGPNQERAVVEHSNHDYSRSLRTPPLKRHDFRIAAGIICLKLYPAAA